MRKKERLRVKRNYKKKFMNDFNHIEAFKIKFREMNIFLRNKFRYLIPLNIKFAFFPNENNTQYFIMRVLNETNNSSFTKAQCSCYILTNANLIIQNLI